VLASHPPKGGVCDRYASKHGSRRSYIRLWVVDLLRGCARDGCGAPLELHTCPAARQNYCGHPHISLAYPNGLGHYDFAAGIPPRLLEEPYHGKAPDYYSRKRARSRAA
jgi:hypothetical protein